ncbi:ribonuclease H-like domain-containing protein [Lysinibacillus odysseyi]|uniref:Exonuclease n=2 Tax=Lysinibacillus odysseyi TaxID=202611 RepID=A0A0A3IFR6_9BACI|nr:ribonuclease H-like domain-containing protein [Lysinibacillus odysseyi]KGR81668.1 exonuclease [Lysinibacillus odysseyi 34hs-1 = NBRC 100172]
MSYENKILQMKKMLGKKTETKQEKSAFIKPDQPQYVDQWQRAGLTLVENDFGVLFKRVVTYPLTYRHGHYELQQLFDAIRLWEQSGREHPYAVTADETLIFFDTETTGLKGVGTHIFLLGFLETDGEEFTLTQYVLADPSNEAALLFESRLWQKKATIVTYNGKSFDWPQLETRWTLNQTYIPKLRPQKQIDLLHSTKRLWKNDLEKMKLTAIEQEKLGFHRQGDIPGFLAPIIYLDAVKSGQADALIKVLHHNEWDLLSLITLYIHSTQLLFQKEVNDSAVTYTNIGKWYNDLKQKNTGIDVLTAVTERFDPTDTGLAHYYLAMEQKRASQYEQAVKSLIKALPAVDIPHQIKAYEQLAIITEHHLRDYEEAKVYTQTGMQLIGRHEKWSALQKEKYHSAWEKRLHRITNKLNK